MTTDKETTSEVETAIADSVSDSAIDNKQTAAEAVAEPKVEAKEVEAKEHKQPRPAPAATAAPYAVVGGGATDPVYLDKCVYKNKAARKSLSVHHVQRRLFELGYRDAGTDKDGWYGDLTLKAVLEFQSDKGLDGGGHMNADTLHALFKGDPNVTVVV